IKVADHIVDLGLGAGEQGGRVVFSGTLAGLMQEPRSLTSKYLRQELAIPVPTTRRRGTGQKIKLAGASEDNLQNVDVSIALTASHFSFNVPGGRCEACQGEGEVRVEMQFLADVFVPCDQCDGKRFKPQVLEVRYRGRSIHQVLDLTVREALTFFSSSPKVLRRLQVLDEIGLVYLRLGQPATTLSGGEAQ